MPGRRVDLNADVGEGGPVDAGLLEVVTSASVACGFHAGTPSAMIETARRARDRGVILGAHPSFDDREGFGRRKVQVGPGELFAAVVYQVGAMAAAAVAAGATIRYVKPHGALYNQAAADRALAEPVVAAVASAGLALLAPAGSELCKEAAEQQVDCFTEAFADRAYTPDGRLASRDQAGAVLHDPAGAAARAVRLVLTGEVTSTDGSTVGVEADSLCVHGDTPGALELARAVRRALEEAGVEIEPFVS